MNKLNRNSYKKKKIDKKKILNNNKPQIHHKVNKLRKIKNKEYLEKLEVSFND